MELGFNIEIINVIPFQTFKLFKRKSTSSQKIDKQQNLSFLISNQPKQKSVKMVGGGGGPQLPFAQTFASSAIAACTAEVRISL
jgi:hypothetical protein